MAKLQITLLSDTHNKHNQLNYDLVGGDIIIHAGDISSMGHNEEIKRFVRWYDNLPYTHKIFIAGNHDFGFEQRESEVLNIIREETTTVTYLKDNFVIIEGLKIYGSPWQPRFYDWAFNVDRNSAELNKIWEKIPDDTDILVTHGPAWGYVDRVVGRVDHLGCELLVSHIKDRIKPILHVCGHIHSGRGVISSDGITFINASVLNERYDFEYPPFRIELDTDTKNITFHNVDRDTNFNKL